MAAAKEADPHKSRSTTGKLKKKKKSLSALVTVHHLFRTISMDVNDVDFHRKALN
jgi:predicted MarR family transcription regulator